MFRSLLTIAVRRAAAPICAYSARVIRAVPVIRALNVNSPAPKAIRQTIGLGVRWIHATRSVAAANKFMYVCGSSADVVMW